MPGMNVSKSPAPTPVRVAMTPTLIAPGVPLGRFVPLDSGGVVPWAVVPGVPPEQEASTAAAASAVTAIRVRRLGPAAPVGGWFKLVPLMVGHQHSAPSGHAIPPV